MGRDSGVETGQSDERRVIDQAASDRARWEEGAREDPSESSSWHSVYFTSKYSFTNVVGSYTKCSSWLEYDTTRYDVSFMDAEVAQWFEKKNVEATENVTPPHHATHTAKRVRVQFKEHVYVDVHNLSIYKSECVCVCLSVCSRLTL
jgi:hypothetical protein